MMITDDHKANYYMKLHLEGCRYQRHPFLKSGGKKMIAICNTQGAFLYDISDAEADIRIQATIEKGNNVLFKKEDFPNGTLDYDMHGNRQEHGMCGWLFMSQDLIRQLRLLRCDAIYIMEGPSSYKKYQKQQYGSLETAYRKTFGEKV